MKSGFSRHRARMNVIGLLLAGVLSHSGAGEAADPISFREQIAPLLLDNCVACHGVKNAEGGYRVDTFAALQQSGDSGEPPLRGAEDEAGELLRRLTTSDEFERMPAESDPLTEEQIQLVTDWIAEGATFDGDHENALLPMIIPARRHPDPPESYAKAVPIAALTFSPDGSRVLAGGYHEVTVWDVTSATLADRIPNVGQRVFALAFNPADTDQDGGTLAVACGEPGRSGEVRLIDFPSGEVIAVLARTTDVAFDVAFRPGAPELAVASADQQIRIVNLETLEVVRTLSSHADWVTAVAWSDDGSRLVSASRDGSAKLFDGESGQLLTSYKGHPDAVRDVMMSPDGQQVLSVGSDNQLHRWETDDAEQVAAVPLGAEGYKLVRGDGVLWLPSADKRLRRIDLSENIVDGEFEGFSDWVLSAAWHADSGRVAAAAFDGEIRIWHADDGELVQSWIAKP